MCLFEEASMSLAQEVPPFRNRCSKCCPPHLPLQGMAPQADAWVSPEAQPAPAEAGATKLGEERLDSRLDCTLHNFTTAEQGMHLAGISLGKSALRRWVGKGSTWRGMRHTCVLWCGRTHRHSPSQSRGKEPWAKAKDPIAERGSYAGLAQSNQHQSGASGLAPDSATPCSTRSPLSLDNNHVT